MEVASLLCPAEGDLAWEPHPLANRDLGPGVYPHETSTEVKGEGVHIDVVHLFLRDDAQLVYKVVLVVDDIELQIRVVAHNLARDLIGTHAAEKVHDVFVLVVNNLEQSREESLMENVCTSLII